MTSKVWIENYGYEACRKSVEESLRKLKTEYLDLMLLHQPFSDYYGAWRALEDLYEEGKLRAIGISNFYPDRMVDIASFARICPMVNQVETHSYDQQVLAKEYMDKYGVQIAALDKKESSFFSHNDPAMVEWFVRMVEGRKSNHDSSKEKKNW